jgi:phospholipid/cholesterol/gamma-HCH transport system substrate-binding protein
VLDQTGAVIELPLEEALAQGRCGVEGGGTGGRRNDGSGGSSATTASRTGGQSILDGMDVGGELVEPAPDGNESVGPVGSQLFPKVGP